VYVLLFGDSAMGKSSLINNIDSNGEEGTKVSRRCAVRNESDKTQNETLTKEYRQYEIKNSNIVLVDVWGFKKNANYLKGEYGHILTGKFKNGQKMTDSAPSERNINYLIDVVVFVVDYLTISGSPIAALLDDHEPFVKEAQEQKCVVLFAVTKMDKSPQLKDIKLERDKEHAINQMNEEVEFKKFNKAVRGRFPDAIVVPLVNDEEGARTKNRIVQESSISLLNIIVDALGERTVDDIGEDSTEMPPKHVPLNFFEEELALEVAYYQQMTVHPLNILI